jgi:DNA-binding Lrp family transcriptional regulator
MASMLLPQDVLVLLKLVTYAGRRPPMAQMAGDLALSPSQVHASLKRLERSRLIAPTTNEPHARAVEEFLLHGVKYAFPTSRGEATRGVPTAYAAPPLSKSIADAGDPPPVWPHPEGAVRGQTLEPLHRAVPKAALQDPALYEMLALIDALRDGRVRERQLAERELTSRIRRQLGD